jgi:hypothetical protein
MTNLRRFQRIAQWWACRKTPAAEQNNALEAKELEKAAVERRAAESPAVCGAPSQTSSSRRQTLLRATTAHDLLARPEMMT